MVVAMMVMMTMCRESGACTKNNHSEQQSFFHALILATAGAVSGNFRVTPANQDKSSILRTAVPRLCRTPKKKISVISR
jgi:hypothetical protein